MTATLPIPRRPKEITSRWLTAALREGRIIDQAQVTALTRHPVGEKEGFMSSLFRIQPVYAPPEAPAPASLIAKLVLIDSDDLRDLQRGNNLRETSFYQAAQGHTLPVPRVYYGRFDPASGECVLLLEDLSTMRSVDFLAGCTVAEAEAAVRALARIHIHWWNSPDLARAAWTSDLAAFDYPALWAAYPAAYDALFPGRPLPASLLEIGRRMAGHYGDVTNRLQGSPATLIHRDCHVDNILFGGMDESLTAVVVDWQAAGRGLGVSDIAYMLISSLPPAQRRAAEYPLVQLYHNLLLQAGITDYNFDQCWSDYLFSAVAKLFITVVATVLVDNTDDHRRAWRTADLGRLAAFVDDHGLEAAAL